MIDNKDGEVEEADKMLKHHIVKEQFIEEKIVKLKLYKLRWLVLLLFVLYAASSAVQWIQYSIITNIIMRYYSISAAAVDWTSMIAMITYPPLLIPGSYIIDKMGLRVSALLGVAGTAMGSWIKVFSVEPHLFWLALLGQGVTFAAQIFILSLPPKIAAVWFGPNEVSTACAIGVFGTQLGTAVGFILPPIIVKNHDNLDEIGQELSYLVYGIALFTTPLVILVFIFVKSKPELPPSFTQLELRNNEPKFTSKVFWSSYKELLTNKPFMLLVISYGMNIGVFASVCTLLNQFILSYFPNSEEDAGRMGLLLVVIGMVGCVIFGFILDRTKKYKEMTLMLYIMTTVGVVVFMFGLRTNSKVCAYLSSAFMGLFQTAYYAVGFEFAAELTYPQPESTSSGILVTLSQICGVLYTLLLRWLYNTFDAFWALASMALLLMVGCIITAITPNILKRQAALSGEYTSVQSK